MTNLVHLRSAIPSTTAPTTAPISVGKITRNLDMLFTAGVIDCDAYRLGYIVAARMQASNSFIVSLSWAEACKTVVLVNQQPQSAAMSADAEVFSRALMELQMHCGIFSHTKRTNLIRAKDRFTHFLCNLGGTKTNLFELLPQDTEVLLQYRPELEEVVHQCAQDAIINRLWACKFAHISTDHIEKVINS